MKGICLPSSQFIGVVRIEFGKNGMGPFEITRSTPVSVIGPLFVSGVCSPFVSLDRNRKQSQNHKPHDDRRDAVSASPKQGLP